MELESASGGSMERENLEPFAEEAVRVIVSWRKKYDTTKCHPQEYKNLYGVLGEDVFRVLDGEGQALRLIARQLLQQTSQRS